MIIITGVPDYFMLLCCGYKVIQDDFAYRG
ncbi:hypothetical protein SAMN05216323_101944 [Williamwhitmania taraxaci]|uniref:Uncharacterized protein n=1 Tax=Williamwhitmania taraxaci TaxID=1640674 RepID=A0A1G6JC60_9BACT|nr:hypothetical protein SAMN05216323_101944 [Williamwhitmania taraxaci]